jgi:hypothetical protein
MTPHASAPPSLPGASSWRQSLRKKVNRRLDAWCQLTRFGARRSIFLDCPVPAASGAASREAVAGSRRAGGDEGAARARIAPCALVASGAPGWRAVRRALARAGGALARCSARCSARGARSARSGGARAPGEPGPRGRGRVGRSAPRVAGGPGHGCSVASARAGLQVSSSSKSISGIGSDKNIGIASSARSS